MNLSLFDPDPDTQGGFPRVELARRLRALADENIWVGTSSWKYEGWLGQIYTRDLYTTRRKFSRAKFKEECLREFAGIFPTVCGDFSFYQFPTPEYWAKLFEAAPASLRFALKAPEEVTVEVFPKQDRYGKKGGEANPLYLSAEAFAASFLEPLEPYRERMGPVIFEFGAGVTTLREFSRRLDSFFGKLPETFRYAVEIRNPDYLQPHYFDCLRTHKVAHVFNAWTRMPTLTEQMRMDDAFTTDFVVVRALLRQGRTYEEAEKRFASYNRVEEENPEVRAALRFLIRRMREEHKAAYIYVGNGLEGNSPETIQAIVTDDL